MMTGKPQADRWPVSATASAAARTKLLAQPGKGLSHFVNGIEVGSADARTFTIPRRKCIKLAAANNTVTVADNAALQFGTKDFAISLWLKTAIGDVSFDALMTNREAGPGEGYLVEITAAGVIKVTLEEHGGETAAITGSTAVNDGRWHHVFFYIDRSSDTGMNLYIDNTADATAVDGSGMSSGNISPTGAGGLIFTGEASPEELYLGPVALYQATDLSATFSTILAECWNSGIMYKFLGTETSISAAWNMDEGVSTAIYDLVGTNNGTLANGSFVNEDPSKETESLPGLGPFYVGAAINTYLTFNPPIKIGDNNDLVIVPSGALTITVNGYTDDSGGS